MRDPADSHDSCKCKVQSTRTSHHQSLLTPGFRYLQNRTVVSVKGGCIEGLDWQTAIHLWYVHICPLPFAQDRQELTDSV